MSNMSRVFEVMKDNKGFSGKVLSKSEAPEDWTLNINKIRMASYNYAIQCKNAENAVKVSADDVYRAFKSFCETYCLPVKADKQTAVYLSGRAMRTVNNYSDYMQSLYAEKRELSDLGQDTSVIEDKIKSGRRTAYAVFKVDTIVSERVFRKTFEDYLVTLMEGLTDMSAEKLEERRAARRAAKKAKKAQKQA